MALKITVNVSKKIPGAEDYSSNQASCSIEGEVAVGQDPAAEAARLYAAAEAAVDRQLGLAAAPTSPAQPHPAANHRAANPAQAPAQRPARAYAPRTAPTHRRGPPPATPSQLGLLQRLIGANQEQTVAITQHYGVAQLSDLTVAEASEAIDHIKGPAR